jgi:membrane protease YdiL (CAAX protease family)
MHFQFFGFIPRMLLGALFGYLYYWTGSLWVSAFAHALNNSMAVITAWLDNNGYMSCDLDSIGVATGSFPYMALISLMVTVLLLVNHKRLFLKK